MRTFTESLKTTTNLRMVRESFILMSERGIDPNDFVEWYTTDGIGMQDQGLLTEASEEWLKNEIYLNEGFFDRFKQGYQQTANRPKSSAVTYGLGRALGGASELGGKVGGWLQGQGGDIAKSFNSGVEGNPYSSIHPGSTPPGSTPQPAYTQHAKNAATAVDALSKRMSKSKSLMEKLGGPSFQAAVVNLLHLLNNPANIAQAASADTPSFESNGFGEFTRKIRLHNEIKTGLRTLQEHGIDPVKFVDWYIEEGQYLNEGMFDGAKDWFGRQWANAKGAWNQWGKAGDEYQAQKDQGRDTDAIQQAMHALGELEKGMTGSQPTEDFAAALKQVKAGLNQAATPETAPEATPETAPETTPETAPETAPEAKSDPLQSHLKNLIDVSKEPPVVFQAEIPEIMASAEKAGVDKDTLLSMLKKQGVDLAKLGLPEPNLDTPHTSKFADHNLRNKNKMPLFFEYLKRRV